MFLAAGWATSISRRIAFPSLVNLVDTDRQLQNSRYFQTYRMPPMGSKIILSMDFGPKQVRITSATVCFGNIRLHVVAIHDKNLPLPL